MRLPRIKELTPAQKKVYLYAPNEEHVLVHGPPGTGKTLIACLRAIELQKRQVPVVLCMFSKVLTKYSSNVGGETRQSMPSTTVQEWFRKWWGLSGLPPHPAAGEIALEVPYADNDVVKRIAGVRWDKERWRSWERRKGAWVVEYETWVVDPGAFSSWPLWQDPPVVDGNRFKLNWEEASNHLIDHEDLLTPDALNLGTLLIDEGQDFSPGFYKFLQQLSVLSRLPHRKTPHPLRCFVLADQNQQLTDENSLLKEIATALKISKDHQYLLLDNFRNSLEIAKLAREFSADVGALPNLPMRTSEKPTYAIVQDSQMVVDQIKTWVVNNPGKEAGVLVFNEKKREEFSIKLKEAMEGIRGRNITVQSYSWKSRAENKANDLLFDSPDVLTVLIMQSCKGLEFDGVFILDLYDAQIGLYGVDRFKMQMFVGVSRGRDWVQLIDSGQRTGNGAYLAQLPEEEFLSRLSPIEPGQGRLPGRSALSGRASLSMNKPQQSLKDASPKNSSLGSWEVSAFALAKKHGLDAYDKRDKGGAFWVRGDQTTCRRELESLGFKFSIKGAGWWRK